MMVYNHARTGSQRRRFAGRFKIAGALLALAAAVGITVPTKAQVISPIPAAVTQFDFTGFIQAATLDRPNDIFSGGTITVNNVKIVVPYYTVLQMPAFALTWQELFTKAPAPYTGLQTGLAQQDVPKPKYLFEAHVVGNRLPDGRHIAGLIFLAQHSLHSGQGWITALNFADGSMTVDGTTRVKINDPIGRFSVGIPDALNPDPRFTIDEDNPTIRASSAYPMCIPRGPSDPLCPQKNRPLSPVDGVSHLGFFTMQGVAATPTPANIPDPYLMAPFEVGDFVTYNGIMVDDATTGTYVLAHTVIGELTILTAPNTLPAYTAIDVLLQGAVSKAAGGGVEGAVRTRVEGFSTDAGGNTAVNIYALDIQPCAGTEGERLWNDSAAKVLTPYSIDIDSVTVLGRWRFRPSARDEAFLPPTRMVRARNTGLNAVDHAVILTPNGLKAGEYTAPDFEFIFSEAVPPGGAPPPPNSFENLAFLAIGEGPYNGGAPTGQLTPWPSLVPPVSTLGCATPPPPPPTIPPAGTAGPVANTDALSITGSTLSFSSATLLANDTGSSVTFAGVAPISTGGGTITGTGPFVFTPVAGFSGTDTFTYEISDAFGQTALGFVNVTTGTVTNRIVPSVVGLTQAAAQTAITGAGLTVGAITSANSATVAAGKVISETPAAGTSVPPASSVALVVSLGPANVTVPNVVGLTQAAAQTAITGAGLTVGAITSANSATIAAGSVISENPASGASVPPGSAVALLISLGPGNITVPNVVGLTQAAAQSTITGTGLTIGAVTSANSATVPAGAIISQSPASGASVAPGSAVALTVSLGPATVIVTVPNVVGLIQADAQAAIAGASLVGAPTSVFDAAVAGQVISQTPTGGTAIAAGSVVGYVVSLGPAPVAPTAQVTVSADGTGARTTPAFSTTTPGEVLVAFAGSDGPTTGANTQNLTISGAGLTWTRVQRAATSRGVSEIWTATAPAALTNVTVTSTQSVTVVLGAAVNQSLTVVAFTGVSGIGASGVFSGVSNNATGSLVMSTTGSAVYGVGNDFDRAVSRTVGAGQTKIHQFLSPSGDTFWAQSLNNVNSIKGSTQTLNATITGAADQWNFAMVELLR